MRLKKNDTVKIIAGKDKGRTGKIIKVDPENERVYVQGANMVMKTQKKRTQQDKGGIVEIEAPIHVSNRAASWKSRLRSMFPTFSLSLRTRFQG